MRCLKAMWIVALVFAAEVSAVECAFITSTTIGNPSLTAIELGDNPSVKTIPLPVRGPIALAAGKLFAAVSRIESEEEVVATAEIDPLTGVIAYPGEPQLGLSLEFTPDSRFGVSAGGDRVSIVDMASRTSTSLSIPCRADAERCVPAISVAVDRSGNFAYALGEVDYRRNGTLRQELQITRIDIAQRRVSPFVIDLGNVAMPTPCPVQCKPTVACRQLPIGQTRVALGANDREAFAVHVPFARGQVRNEQARNEVVRVFDTLAGRFVDPSLVSPGQATGISMAPDDGVYITHVVDDDCPIITSFLTRIDAAGVRQTLIGSDNMSGAGPLAISEDGSRAYVLMKGNTASVVVVRTDDGTVLRRIALQVVPSDFVVGVVEGGCFPPATSTPTPTQAQFTPTSSATRTPTRPATQTPTPSRTSVPSISMPPTVSRTSPPPNDECAGDCDRDGVVAINEIVSGVAIALNREPLDACATLDDDRDGVIAVHEIIAAVRNLLVGCPAPSPRNSHTQTPLPPSFAPTATATARSIAPTPTASRPPVAPTQTATERPTSTPTVGLAPPNVLSFTCEGSSRCDVAQGASFTVFITYDDPNGDADAFSILVDGQPLFEGAIDPPAAGGTISYSLMAGTCPVSCCGATTFMLTARVRDSFGAWSALSPTVLQTTLEGPACP